MTLPYNCTLFGRDVALGQSAHSDKGTTIKRYIFHIRTSSGQLIFAMGPCEYDVKYKTYLKEWSQQTLSDDWGYLIFNYSGAVYYTSNLDETVLNNAYIEVRWFSVLEIKEYYAKILLTKSDIELLKELALNDGFSYSSLWDGQKHTPIVRKEVNFVIRLSVGGIGFINVNRDNGEEYFFKHIFGVAVDDDKQISRIQKLTQLKELDYAQFFKDKYKDNDFLKTFEKARQIAKEANNDISKCYPFNNYGSIISSIRLSTNIYRYKINIDRRYKVAYLEIETTAQETYQLIGKQIFEKNFIAAPIRNMFAIIELPTPDGKKIWEEMSFEFFSDNITSCSSPNKSDKERFLEYFKILDELSGYPEIIGDKINVNKKGVHNVVDRKIYEQLTPFTYTFTFEFENDRMSTKIFNKDKIYPFALSEVTFLREFLQEDDKPAEYKNNNIPIFPEGTELD